MARAIAAGATVMRQEAQGLAAAPDHRHAGVVAHGPDGAREVGTQQRAGEGRLGRRHLAPRPQVGLGQRARVKGFNVQHRHLS
jgi:hypothetical protein